MIVTLFTYRYYVRFAGIFINIKLKKRSSFVGQRDVLMQVFFYGCVHLLSWILFLGYKVNAFDVFGWQMRDRNIEFEVFDVFSLIFSLLCVRSHYRLFMCYSLQLD